MDATGDELAALETGQLYIQIDSELAPDGNIWGATVNKTSGDAEKLDDVVFPLFPQGGGFPRNNDDKT